MLSLNEHHSSELYREAQLASALCGWQWPVSVPLQGRKYERADHGNAPLWCSFNPWWCVRTALLVQSAPVVCDSTVCGWLPGPAQFLSGTKRAPWHDTLQQEPVLHDTSCQERYPLSRAWLGFTPPAPCIGRDSATLSHSSCCLLSYRSVCCLPQPCNSSFPCWWVLGSLIVWSPRWNCSCSVLLIFRHHLQTFLSRLLHQTRM